MAKISEDSLVANRGQPDGDLELVKNASDIRYAVHDMRNILLLRHISKALMFFWSAARLDHDSEPYRKIAKTKDGTTLILVVFEILLGRYYINNSYH